MLIRDFPEYLDPQDADLLLIQEDLSGAYRSISLATLKLFFGATIAPTVKALNYQSVGDENGLFYWLGTSEGLQPWQNPQALNDVVFTASSILTGYDPLSVLTNRAPSEFLTDNLPDSWVSYRLLDKTLKVSGYYIQCRKPSTGLQAPQSWKLQGSDDGTTWIDLDAHYNNPIFQDYAQTEYFSVSNSTFYKQHRIIQTGLNSQGYNYLCLSEVEFYGDLKNV